MSSAVENVTTIAGDVRRIALALDIHVFCLRAEVEGAILHATKRFEERAQNLTFHVGGAKTSLWFRLCRIFVLQNVGGSEWVPSQKLSACGGVRIGMGCMNQDTAISRYRRYP